MKFGIRTPSISKSVSARTKGYITRSAKRAVIPGYGQRGTGMIKAPKRSVYNRIYRKTSIGLNELSDAGAFNASKGRTKRYPRRSNEQSENEIDDFYSDRNYEITYELPFQISSSALNTLHNMERQKTLRQNETKIKELNERIQTGESNLALLRKSDIAYLIKEQADSVLIISIETTGKSASGEELLSLIIKSGRGSNIIDTLIKPTTRKRWPKATEKHGIHWSDVKTCPTIHDLKDSVLSALKKAAALIFLDVASDAVFTKAFEFDYSKLIRIDVISEYKLLPNTKLDQSLEPLKALAEALNLKEYKLGTPENDAQTLLKSCLKLFKSRKYKSTRLKMVKQDETWISEQRAELKACMSFKPVDKEDVGLILSREFDRYKEEQRATANSLSEIARTRLEMGIIATAGGACVTFLGYAFIGWIAIIFGCYKLIDARSTFGKKAEIEDEIAQVERQQSRCLSSIVVKPI